MPYVHGKKFYEPSEHDRDLRRLPWPELEVDE
jgi:hypothetical protein